MISSISKDLKQLLQILNPIVEDLKKNEILLSRIYVYISTTVLFMINIKKNWSIQITLTEITVAENLVRENRFHVCPHR